MSDRHESIVHLSSESGVERRFITAGMSAPERDAGRNISFNRTLKELAEQAPGSIAIVDGGIELTYGQLEQQTGLIGLHLRESGIQPEDIVAVHMQRGANQVLAMLGALKAGAVCLPIDAAEPPLRLDTILGDSSPRVIITERSFKNRLQCTDAQLIFIDDLHQQLEEAEWIEADGQGAEADSDNLALLLYQSAPIGRVEGVMITHGMLARLACVPELQIEPSDRVGYVSTLWRQSWMMELFPPLAAGATAVTFPDPSSLTPRKFAFLLKDNRITLLMTHARALERLAKEFPWAMSAIRMVLCSDAAEDCRRLIGKLRAHILERVYVCYDSVETSGWWALQPLSELGTQVAAQPLSHLTAGRRMFLLDDGYKPVAPDITGELYIWTDAMARGYHRNPSRTAETLVPNPFSSHECNRLCRTGELARKRSDGSTDHPGRRDWLIYHHGLMFHPQEIEAALLDHNAIAQAAVVNREGTITAFLVAAQDQHPSSAELKQFLKQSIPEAILPANFMFLEDLPRTPDGGLDRKALVNPASLETAKRATSSVAPRDDIERQLAQIWMEAFDAQEPGIHDNFFGIGGYSLLATQVAARISDVFKLHLPLRQVFETPTIAGLAKVIRELSSAVEGHDGEHND